MTEIENLYYPYINKCYVHIKQFNMVSTLYYINNTIL